MQALPKESTRLRVRCCVLHTSKSSFLRKNCGSRRMRPKFVIPWRWWTQRTQAIAVELLSRGYSARRAICAAGVARSSFARHTRTSPPTDRASGSCFSQMRSTKSIVNHARPMGIGEWRQRYEMSRGDYESQNRRLH